MAMHLHSAVLLLDGFQLTSLGALVDTMDFATGALGGEVCSTRLMTPTGKPARSNTDIEIPVVHSTIWPEGLDYVIVVGRLSGSLWRWSNTVSRYLHTADRLNVVLVGIETGVETLARLGLLDGYSACTSASDQERLQEQFPSVDFSCSNLILRDRSRITSLGGVAASDLAASLISEHFSPADAHRAVTALNREGVRQPDTPPPTAMAAVRYSDLRVRRAVIAMEQCISRPRAIDGIACDLGISRRQLERLFQTETGESTRRTYLALRLDHACRMLAQSNAPVAAIAMATGFTDGAHLAKTMRRELHETPTSIRKQTYRTMG